MTPVMRRRYNHGDQRRFAAQPCLKRTLPLWEKEFCSKVGLFSWDKFLEAKKYIHIYPRVMVWNDVAGEEAFKMAKKRFKAHYLGLPCKIPLPSSDVFIDVVDWDSKIDPDLLVGLEAISSDDEQFNYQGDDHENAFGNATHDRVVDTPIEAIKPTGWDVDVQEETKDRLVGMIVGDHWNTVVDDDGALVLEKQRSRVPSVSRFDEEEGGRCPQGQENINKFSNWY